MNHQHNHHNHHHTNQDYSSHSHHSHGGGMAHSGHAEMFKEKFWISLILFLPVLFLSPVMGLNLPFQFTFSGSNWIVLVLSTAVFFYGGVPFITGAKDEIKTKSPGIMTLVAMGISVAYFYSVYAFIANNFIGGDHVMDFFWELVTLVVIMLLGHWIEMKAISNASSSLEQLAKLLPDVRRKM
ncbi:copper-exporting ATPase [Streptococcus criceti]|uniref:Copper-exporting P-type ATPase B domain protein n=1 Tax=Streptococcus criceti HS-6 TaxID=873449 RepID=G5JNZ5_STRCG|nr:copper-exporting P-type ATPase B domain protein [Streptococcus criceti HS-6]SUN43405.1 copper-exporting ATPase [Streptococcus criceti]